MARSGKSQINTPLTLAAIDRAIQAADAALCKDNEQIAEALQPGGKGFRSTPSGVWLFTDDLLKARKSLILECLKLLSAHEGSAQDIDAAMWKAIDGGGTIEDRRKIFFEEIASFRTNKTVLAPNGLMKCEDSVQHIIIGDVEICEITHPSIKSLDLPFDFKVGDKKQIYRDGEKRYLEYTKTLWKVSVSGSDVNIREEAYWKILIAVSLIRLCLMDADKIGAYPRLGDAEGSPFESELFDDSRLIVTDGAKTNLGALFSLGCYVIDDAAATHLSSKDINQLGQSVFTANRATVGERLNNGLGWLTLARQTRGRAERFLYMFTALEALLTNDDKQAPITETIARYSACILSNINDDRAALSATIRNWYNIRSKIVHGGRRADVHQHYVMDMQHFIELIYWKVLTTTPLETKTDQFYRDLKRASFGVPWPTSVSTSGSGE